MMKDLKSKLPRVVYLQNIGALSPEDIASGYLDACPNKAYLSKYAMKHEQLRRHLKMNGNRFSQSRNNKTPSETLSKESFNS